MVAGWFVKPARFDEEFELNPRGDRRVHVVRPAHKIETEQGSHIDCEFQIDRT